MTLKDFWLSSKIGIIGGGTWGTVLANLVAPHCREVRIWARNEEAARAINTTRVNTRYLPNLALDEKIHAVSELDRFFEGELQALIWALPTQAYREQARIFAPRIKGDELLFHATKGIEPHSMKRVSEILSEELPCRRIGVISGPNFAHEVGKGEPTGAMVASTFEEVCEAGQILLSHSKFQVYSTSDLIGIEWAGALKNILAIAVGAADTLGLGYHAQAMLITLGLAEMIRFAKTFGAQESTFLGLAGLADLLATCRNTMSRNYAAGRSLGQGLPLHDILKSTESTIEGIATTQSVYAFAEQQKISMPITQGVNRLILGEKPAEGLWKLFTRDI